MKQYAAPEITEPEFLEYTQDKRDYRPPFEGPNILTLTRTKEDVAALKALGYDAVIPGSRRLPDLNFDKGCPPIVVAMGYGWEEEEETRRICKFLGNKLPITASSFNYHKICEVKPESLSVYSVIFADSSEVSAYRSELVTCMKKDRFKVCRLWESLNLPAEQIFRPANMRMKTADGGNN